MISPTGKGIRGFDGHGTGRYGAPRDGRMHRGVDFICDSGQDIVCPIDNAKVIRESKPYKEDLSWSGIVLKNEVVVVQMFYFEPVKGIFGKAVKQGDLLGYAQDISLKYPGMIPHIHLRIVDIDPALFLRLP